MDNKTINKIGLFFTGLVSRLEENREYFREIRIELGSGTKTFPARVFYEGDSLVFTLMAHREETTSDKLWECISRKLSDYDSAVLEYDERGACIRITADKKQVKLSHVDKIEETLSTAASQNSKRQYIVNPALAKELLAEIGILADNGKIKNDKIRKYNQIDYFVELMGDIINEFPEDKEIIVMDCACGKSYLSFVLNFYMREILKRKCRFVGIDYSDVVISASNRIKDKLGYNNMEFIREDLTTYVPSVGPDIVISLHACDTATDMAIGLGIREGAKAIVSVPCCHKDILKQYSYEPFSQITKHGILKARLADTLTDGLRGAYLESRGYNVSMIEYISPLETPKNIMIRAVYTGKKNKASADGYESLKKMLSVCPAIERFSTRIEEDAYEF